MRFTAKLGHLGAVELESLKSQGQDPKFCVRQLVWAFEPLAADERHLNFRTQVDYRRLSTGFRVAVSAHGPEFVELLSHGLGFAFAQGGAQIVATGGEQAGVDAAGGAEACAAAIAAEGL